MTSQDVCKQKARARAWSWELNPGALVKEVVLYFFPSKMYLFERIIESERKRVRMNEHYLPFMSSLPKWPQRLWSGQTEVRIPELHPVSHKDG